MVEMDAINVSVLIRHRNSRGDAPPGGAWTYYFLEQITATGQDCRVWRIVRKYRLGMLLFFFCCAPTSSQKDGRASREGGKKNRRTSCAPAFLEVTRPKTRRLVGFRGRVP